MKKNRLFRYIAVVTALGMAAVSPMTALAETVDKVSIEGKSEGTVVVDAVANDNAGVGIGMKDGSTEKLDASVTVKGDVSVTDKNTSRSDISGATIYSNGGSAVLDIKGSVYVENTNDNAYNYADGIEDEYNSNSNITVGGDVTVKANNSQASGVSLSQYGNDTATKTVTIGGSVEVTSNNASALGVSAKKANVTIGGSVEANAGDRSFATGVEVLYPGNVVNIGESVTASGAYTNGIYVHPWSRDGDVSISVGGDVNSSGTTYGTGIYVSDNKGTADIQVNGDVKTSTNGIIIDNNLKDAVTSVTVGGTLSASGENGHAIVVENYTDDAADPIITVWKIESTDSLVKVENDYGADKVEDKDAEERIKSNINYIIRADATENGKDSSNGKIVLSGTKGTVTVGEKTYDTAHQDDTIIINVETVKGYKSTLQNNGAGTLTVNADGTYTLTIPEGGGVSLEAVLEKIEKYHSGGSSSGSGSVSTATYIGNWVKDNTGWMAKKLNGSFANSEWYQLEWNGMSSWYHFNNQGYAEGGWFTDTDGQRYYLCNAHDGSFGRMCTGWNLIDGQWYYFSTATANGSSIGSLVVSTNTPDGYTVGADGVWAE